jgi:hypothetical protein
MIQILHICSGYWQPLGLPCSDENLKIATWFRCGALLYGVATSRIGVYLFLCYECHSALLRSYGDEAVREWGLLSSFLSMFL